MKVSAIIVSAGKGIRMGSDTPKPFIKICGIPIIVLTLSVFNKCKLIDEIILVVNAGEIDNANKIIKKYKLSKVNEIVAGGKERQNSVSNGLRIIGDDCDIIIIHDGARPFVTEEIIKSSISEAKYSGAAVAGVPVKDTIKTVDASGEIDGTLNRTKLWAAQTPQTFKADLIKSAYKTALSRGINATDDSMMVEHIGHKVTMVTGSHENIKITTPEDLVIAEAIMKNAKI